MFDGRNDTVSSLIPQKLPLSTTGEHAEPSSLSLFGGDGVVCNVVVLSTGLVVCEPSDFELELAIWSDVLAPCPTSLQVMQHILCAHSRNAQYRIASSFHDNPPHNVLHSWEEDHAELSLERAVEVIGKCKGRCRRNA